MVRELFEMARTKKACLIFFDEIDAVGGARYYRNKGVESKKENRSREREGGSK